MEELSTRHIQEGLLKGFDWFRAFAEKNSIEYVVDAGCLLGAIREQNFIPWDDDMDITMSPEGFLKFVKAMERADLPDELEFIAPSNYSMRAVNPYSAKLRLRGLKGSEPNLVQRGLDDGTSSLSGPSIDFVSLSYIPKSRLLQTVIIGFSRNMARILRARKGSYESHVNAKYRVLNFCCSRIPEVAISWLESQVRKLRNLNESNVVCYSLGDIFPTPRWYFRDYFPPSTGQFEGRTIPIPARPEVILESLYGPNFMTPPPAHLRESHFKELVLEEAGATYFSGLGNRNLKRGTE